MTSLTHSDIKRIGLWQRVQNETGLFVVEGEKWLKRRCAPLSL